MIIHCYSETTFINFLGLVFDLIDLIFLILYKVSFNLLKPNVGLEERHALRETFLVEYEEGITNGISNWHRLPWPDE